MSLRIEYFVVTRFERLNGQKNALEKMLTFNNAKNNADEWNLILKDKYKHFVDFFNKPEMRELVDVADQDKLYDCLRAKNFEKNSKLCTLMEEADADEPHFFEIETINSVINFASACKTSDDLQKIWELPKISAKIDFRNPQNKYSQFMGAGTKKQISECLKTKNDNPVYSECFIMVPNHYDMDVGLLDFNPEIKKAIDDLVKKAARYVAAEFAKILENGPPANTEG